MSKVYVYKVTGEINAKMGGGSVPVSVETIPVHVEVTLISEGLGIKFLADDSFCQHDEFADSYATESASVDVNIYKVQGMDEYIGYLAMNVTHLDFGDIYLIWGVESEADAYVVQYDDGKYMLFVRSAEETDVSISFRVALQ